MLHPTTFSLRQFCGIAFSPSSLLGQLSGVVFQHSLWGNSAELYSLSLRQFYRIVFSKYFFQNNSSQSYYTKVSLRQFCRIVSQNIFFFRQLSEVVFPPYFSLRQFYGIVFSKHFLWGNSAELYSQNIFFRATLRSCIPTLPFEAIMHNCILKTFHLRQLSIVVFSHFPFRQLCEVVFSQHFIFEAILRNCILKTFPLRQFCGIVFSKYFILRQFYWIVFSKHFLWGNSAELYSQNSSFEAILLNCILRTFPFEVVLWNCILTLSLLGQLWRVAFPQMSEDIISPHE